MRRFMLIALLLLSACGSLDSAVPTPTAGTIYELEPAGASADQASQQTAQVALPVIPADDSRSLGDPNAPVTIIEYSDFQCPFCQRHIVETFPLIKANYIDTGKVRYVFRNFIAVPQHTVAPAAAVASLCAAEQQQFWPMHERLFKQPDQWYILPDRANAMFADYAIDLGLDTGAFARCLQRPELPQQVASETQAAFELGLRGTPGFFVGRQFINGAQSYPVFASAIDLALADGNN